MSALPLLLTALLTSLAPAEIVTLITGNRLLNSSQPAFSRETITLEEGDLITALYLSNNAHVDVTIANTLIRIDANNPDQRNLPVIKGPATVRLSNFSNLNASLGTFRITRVNEPVTPATPALAVVIPSDGTGDYSVSLESSADLVTWTATQPGVFQSTVSARFFRAKVAKKAAE